jgi:hypothetical protein
VLETPHVIVGAAIATKVVNPVLAIPLAFGSHFILEKVPHWDPPLSSEIRKFNKLSNKTKKIIVIDSGIAFISGSIIALSFYPDITRVIIIYLACFAAAIPDLVEAPYYLIRKNNKYIEKKWIPFKKTLQAETSLVPGLLTQLITIAAALWWIFN